MIRHRFFMGLISALFFAMPATCCAQREGESLNDLERGQSVDEFDTTTEIIPSRELKFEVIEEAAEMKLFRADPQLFKQRYVAVVELRIDESQRRDHSAV